MTTTSKITLLLAGALAVVAGCKKEESSTPTPAPAGSTSTLRDVFDQNVADATQTFSLNANTGGWIQGTEGTKLFFQAGAFLDQAGLPVTGAVEVGLVEILSVGDMVWTNKQTMGNSGGTPVLLTSGGELLVTARQGTQSLSTIEDGMFVRIPTISPDPSMSLFAGAEDADGQMIWEPIDTVTAPVFIIPPDTSMVTYSYGFSYQLSSTTLNWINCDYFYGSSWTSLTATPPTGHPLDSTFTWIIYPSVNGVTQLSYTGVPQVFGNSGVPLGMDAVIVSLYRNGSQYYSSFNPVTITSAMDVPMTYSATTLNQFEMDIAAL